MVVCTNYNFRFWHIFLPPPELIYKICIIRDKSKLFLSSVLRILFYVFILDFLLANKYITYKGEDKKKYIFYALLIIIILSFLSMILVFFKFPFLDEQQIVDEANKEAKKIDVDPEIKSGLEKRSLGRTETEKIFLPEVLEVPGRLKSIS